MSFALKILLIASVWYFANTFKFDLFSQRENNCKIDNIFQGHWSFAHTVVNHTSAKRNISFDNAYSACPLTKEAVVTFNLTHQKKYSCSDYRDAHWRPKSCYIMSLTKSILKIAKHLNPHLSDTMVEQEVHKAKRGLVTGSDFNAVKRINEKHSPHHLDFPEVSRAQRIRRLNVTFLGDSLTAQVFLGTSCSLESKNLHNFVNFDFKTEIWFRYDVPCQDNCTLPGDEGVQFRNKSKTTSMDVCSACRDGIRRQFDDIDFQTEWAHEVSNDTNVLVIGTGAWFSAFGVNGDSNYEYSRTLEQLILPAAKKLQNRLNLTVYWQDLPPFILPPDPTGAQWTKQNLEPKNRRNLTNEYIKSWDNIWPTQFYYRQLYEWHTFEEKNAIARKLIQEKFSGIVYLDSWPSLMKRKSEDLFLTSDGLHWCNPGPFSAPTIIGHSILHLFASSLQ